MKRPELFKYGKEYIKSMEVLIERYQMALNEKCSKSIIEEENNLKCLLCNPIGVTKGRFRSFGGNGCEEIGCPWYVILNMSCDDFREKTLPYHYTTIYMSSDPIVIRKRIRQLRNWIRIYKKYMNIL